LQHIKDINIQIDLQEFKGKGLFNIFLLHDNMHDKFDHKGN